MRIASVKTMWNRFTAFSTAVLPNIVEKTSKYVDRVCVVLDKSNADEHLSEYTKLVESISDKIDILVGDDDYNVLNKEICPLQKYGYDIELLTVDDDIMYTQAYIDDLFKFRAIDSTAVICAESNPVSTINGTIAIQLATEIKLFTVRNFSKYLTGCCLFPKNALHNTRLTDKALIKKYGFDRHDELYCWLLTTAKHIPVITTNTTYSIERDATTIANASTLGQFNGAHWTDWNTVINTDEFSDTRQVLLADAQNVEILFENANALAGRYLIAVVQNYYNRLYQQPNITVNYSLVHRSYHGT